MKKYYQNTCLIEGFQDWKMMTSHLNNHSQYSNSRDKNFTLFSSTIPPNNSQIKCFRILRFCYISSNCPNRRAMSVKWGINISYSECAIPYESDLLIVKRMFDHVQMDFNNHECENIFHRRFLINNKLCSIIIDGVVVYTTRKIWNSEKKFSH